MNQRRLGQQPAPTDARNLQPLIGDQAVYLGYVNLTLANGANPDVDVGNASMLLITGPTGAFSISGFTNGEEGRLLVVIYTGTQAMTITNNAGSAVGNRIVTCSGADIVCAGKATAVLVYCTDSWYYCGGAL